MVKKITALLLALVMTFALFGCGASDGEEQDTTAVQTTAKEPEKAPDFTVYDGEGDPVSLYESFGRPLVVNFWATWCPPCKSEMPHFEALYKEYGDRVEFMMIDLTDGTRDTEESVKQFISDNGYSFPVYLDSDMDAAMAYSIQSIPTTIFFDGEGNIVEYKVGAISESQLEGMLIKMTEGTK